jgi:hypothetical protein
MAGQPLAHQGRTSDDAEPGLMLGILVGMEMTKIPPQTVLHKVLQKPTDVAPEGFRINGTQTVAMFEDDLWAQCSVKDGKVVTVRHLLQACMAACGVHACCRHAIDGPVLC